MLIKPHGSSELSPRIVEGSAAEALAAEAAQLPQCCPPPLLPMP